MRNSIHVGDGVFASYLNHHLIGGYPSQMKLKNWLEYLRLEPDYDIANFISRGIMYGFSIVDDVHISGDDQQNYKSATQGQAKEFLDVLFAKEVQENKYVRVSTKPTCIHAIGAVPKGQSEFRPITDCKRP